MLKSKNSWPSYGKPVTCSNRNCTLFLGTRRQMRHRCPSDSFSYWLLWGFQRTLVYPSGWKIDFVVSATNVHCRFWLLLFWFRSRTTCDYPVDIRSLKPYMGGDERRWGEKLVDFVLKFHKNYYAISFCIRVCVKHIYYLKARRVSLLYSDGQFVMITGFLCLPVSSRENFPKNTSYAISSRGERLSIVFKSARQNGRKSRCTNLNTGFHLYKSENIPKRSLGCGTRRSVIRRVIRTVSIVQDVACNRNGCLEVFEFGFEAKAQSWNTPKAMFYF